jgi:transposase
MDDAYVVVVRPAWVRVVSCNLSPLVRRSVVMQVAGEFVCRRCVVSAAGKPYDVREMRVKDLPFEHRPLEVRWRKRRYRCTEPRCPQRLFTERSEQLPPRHRHAARRSAAWW